LQGILTERLQHKFITDNKNSQTPPTNHLRSIYSNFCSGTNLDSKKTSISTIKGQLAA